MFNYELQSPLQWQRAENKCSSNLPKFLDWSSCPVETRKTFSAALYVTAHYTCCSHICLLSLPPSTCCIITAGNHISGTVAIFPALLTASSDASQSVSYSLTARYCHWSTPFWGRTLSSLRAPEVGVGSSAILYYRAVWYTRTGPAGEYHQTTDSTYSDHNRQTDCLTDWMTDWMTEWLTDWMTEWLTEWMTDWLTDWLTEWLNDWLTAWEL
jgi:hypothetical protein